MYHLHLPHFHSPNRPPHKSLNTAQIIAIDLFIILMGTVISQSLSMFLAKHLGPEQYGDFSVAMSILELLTLFSLLGSPSCCSRFFSIYLKEDQMAKAKGFLSLLFRLVLSSSLFLTLASLIVIYFLIFHTTSHNSIQHNHIQLLFYVLWILPFWALSKTLSTLMFSLHRPILMKLWQRFFRPLLVLSYLVTLYYYKKSLAPLDILIAFGISICCLLVVQLYFFSTTVPKSVLHSIEREYELHNWFRTALRFFWISIVVNLLPNIDLLMVETFKSNPEITGLFAVTIRPIAIMWLIYEATSCVVSPMFAERFRTDMNAFRTQYFLTHRTVFLGTLLLCGLLEWFLPELINLFGAHYQIILPYARIVVGMACFQVAFSSMQIALQYAGHERSFSHIVSFGLVINVCLDILLIPHYSLAGAITAYSITCVVITFSALITGYRKLGLLPLLW